MFTLIVDFPELFILTAAMKVFIDACEEQAVDGDDVEKALLHLSVAQAREVLNKAETLLMPEEEARYKASQQHQH